MNILITGGLGNLGSWLTRHFVGTEHTVTVLAKNKRPILQDLDFDYITCDIADLVQIEEALKGKMFDVVIHAASVNDGFKENYFHDALIINTLGTRNLLEYFKDKTLKNFIYLSTFQVYGRYSGTITEETPTLPVNDYGNTHLFSEYYLRQMGKTNDFPFTIIRLTNSYGCPTDHNSSKWYLILNDLSKTAFETKEIVMRSNGKPSRDFIWMGDVCELFQRIAESPAENETYNISGEQNYSMVDIAHEVHAAYKEVYGEDISIKINENDTKDYPQDLMVSSQKIRKRYQFECKDKHFKEEIKNIFAFLAAKN